MTTIKDIAEYAGVSATTVSNVIHGKKNRVSQETVDKINEAISKLNYVPNMYARSLVSSSSRVVALINYVPTRSDATFSDDTFQMVFLSTIESILRESGYYLMFRRVETPEELQMFLNNWKLDGLFVSGICNNDFIKMLSKLTIPTVLLDSYADTGNFVNVGHDDAEGAYMATEYLIKNGHRKIAFTTTVMREGYVMQARYEGYKRALADNGIIYDSRLVLEGDVDLESSLAMAANLSRIPALTGVVSSTDLMAAGIMTGFRNRGIRVPEDISIVGFDDIPLCKMTVPPLTTIRQDMVLKASVAADNMVAMLKGEKTAVNRIVLPVELVERASVRNMNKKEV